MFDKVKRKFAEEIMSALGSAYSLNIGLPDLYSTITSTPDIGLGHLAFPCFGLAKDLKKPAASIAEEIASAIKCDGDISAVSAVGPYVNVFMDSLFLGNEVLSHILYGDYFKTQLTDSPLKIMVEFSQPNTHKELHVGHTRNMVMFPWGASSCCGSTFSGLSRYTMGESSRSDRTARDFTGDLCQNRN